MPVLGGSRTPPPACQQPIGVFFFLKMKRVRVTAVRP